MKTQLDELNEFLIKLGSADRICIRRKIITIKKYLENITNKNK